jgi:hypothetical protein
LDIYIGDYVGVKGAWHQVPSVVVQQDRILLFYSTSLLGINERGIDGREDRRGR